MIQTLRKASFACHYRICRLWNRVVPSVTLDGRKVHVLPTVYKPLENEQRLVDVIEPGKDVLDMGCGSGVLGLFAAFKSKSVLAVDINPEAVRNAEMNFAAHGLENASARVSDMFEAVEETFDYIICTPPFFRVAFAGSHQQWSTSTYFVDQLFSSARDYLRPGGCLVVCLPGGYEPDPERLAADGGLELIDRRPLPRRSLGLILHGIPYFQFGMKCQVLSFQAAS